MTRLPGWPARLIACVEAARDRPFAWGSHDCCTFAADCIQAVTGEDVRARAGIGPYDNARVARKALGRGGLKGLATRLLGEPLAFPAHAGRGDVALIRLGRRAWLGVVIDARVACVGPEGLVFVPRSGIAEAWPVGWGEAEAESPSPRPSPTVGRGREA
jgi:hypothetical protein